MALKSKQTKLFSPKPLFISMSVVVTVAYILKKCYDILIHARSKEEEGKWWIISVFSTTDAKTNKDLSLLGIQFYILLFNAVKEDVFVLFSAIKEIWSARLLTVMFQNLVITLMSLIIIVISVYYLLIKSSDQKQKRKNEIDSKVTKTAENPESTLSYSNEDSVSSIHKVNRKYVKCLTGLMFLAFLLSIPWEFIRLYQSMVAEKVAHMTVGIPAECVPEQMSMIQSVKSWIRWQFSWSVDPCLQYHKALLIDPLWQVSPLMVFSLAFSHCIVYPVEVLLGGLGRAFRAFFVEIPAQWQPVMLVFIVIFLLLTLVMLFGYRIHLPFILKIEPKTPVNQRQAPRTSVQLQKEKKLKSIEPIRETDVSKK